MQQQQQHLEKTLIFIMPSCPDLIKVKQFKTWYYSKEGFLINSSSSGRNSCWLSSSWRPQFSEIQPLDLPPFMKQWSPLQPHNLQMLLVPHQDTVSSLLFPPSLPYIPSSCVCMFSCVFSGSHFAVFCKSGALLPY